MNKARKGSYLWIMGVQVNSSPLFRSLSFHETISNRERLSVQLQNIKWVSHLVGIEVWCLKFKPAKTMVCVTAHTYIFPIFKVCEISWWPISNSCSSSMRITISFSYSQSIYCFLFPFSFNHPMEIYYLVQQLFRFNC